MIRRFSWPGAALALIVAAGGCSRSGLLHTTGRLLYHGEPVPSTLVTFVPDDQRRPSKGVTDDKGYFTLRFSRQEDGVLAGPHTVVLSYVPSNEEELGQAPPKATKELKAIIARYGDPKTSTLHYTVTRSGESFEINIE
jgi:hypothetical protein